MRFNMNLCCFVICKSFSTTCTFKKLYKSVVNIPPMIYILSERSKTSKSLTTFNFAFAVFFPQLSSEQFSFCSNSFISSLETSMSNISIWKICLENEYPSIRLSTIYIYNQARNIRGESKGGGSRVGYVLIKLKVCLSFIHFKHK